MKISFLPGDLHLSNENGHYIVRMAGEELIRTPSKRDAMRRFDAVRRELEEKFPSRELSLEEKAELLRSEVGNSLVGHNSLGGRKKKSSARGTRTFGG